MSCKSWILTLMAKKERYRGKGAREAINSRTSDDSGLLNQLWAEVWERWPEVFCGHELVPFLVKGMKEGLEKALSFPQRTSWANIYTYVQETCYFKMKSAELHSFWGLVGMVRFWDILASKGLAERDLGINTEFYVNTEPSVVFVFNKLTATLNQKSYSQKELRKQETERRTN